MNAQSRGFMNTPLPANDKAPLWKQIHWLVWCVLGIAAILFIIDHWAHALGALPYLILLACPLMHLFMHGKHGHGHHNDHENKKNS